jgi:hypothetical protein
MRKHLLQNIAAGLVAVALAAGGIAVATSASASIPTPEAGNITALPSAPRIVAQPGMQLNAGQTVTLNVAGQNFSGIDVPSNATGATVSISSIAPAAAGALIVWTTEAGVPGTGTVAFGAGERNTNITFVGLNSAGRLNVKATVATKFVMSLLAYTTPLVGAAGPKSIPAVAPKLLTDVGGSIRGDFDASGNHIAGTGATDFGSVTLPAGTWDARVVGGFTGLNTATGTCLPDGTFLTGTMILTTGDGDILVSFANVAATAGGVMIPKSNSTTLTQDPTVPISTFLTFNTATVVHVQLFAYASNSSAACLGDLKGNLQSAKFLQVA